MTKKIFLAVLLMLAAVYPSVAAPGLAGFASTPTMPPVKPTTVPAATATPVNTIALSRPTAVPSAINTVTAASGMTQPAATAAANAVASAVPAASPQVSAAGITTTAGLTNAAGLTSAAAAATPADSRIPSNIQIDTSGTIKIKISWTASPAGELAYNVYRKLGAEKVFVVLNSEPLKVTGYVDAAIVTATAYDYKIEAKDNSGNSYMSDVRSASSAGLVMPQKPFTFKAFQNIEKVTLKWSAGIKGSFEISGYNLYRGKTADKMELYKFIKGTAVLYDDEDVEPAIKYYYRMKTADTGGYESDFTDTEAVVPFPKPRTGLILMGTGFRNNIHDNLGLNADFIFTYYIGSILSELAGKKSYLDQSSVILFTGDVKGTVINEFENWPSLGLGFTYSILMQYNLGGSNASGASVDISGKNKDSVISMYGLYLTASKKIIWDNTLHAGFMAGFGGNSQNKFMTYLVPKAVLTEDQDPQKGSLRPSNFTYCLGFGRPLWGKVDLKVELIVPIEGNRYAYFPDYYLINTHVENFSSFDLAYFHFPYQGHGAGAILGFINFRFSIYPNPYK